MNPVTISAINVDHAYSVDYATSASIAGVAYTSSFISGSATVSELLLVNNGATGSFGVDSAVNISSSYTVDAIPITKGNAVKWFVFLEDGTNSKATKIIANWNNTTARFYATEVNSVGNVPVDFDVQVSGSTANLVAIPQSGNWALRYIRITI